MTIDKLIDITLKGLIWAGVFLLTLKIVLVARSITHFVV